MNRFFRIRTTLFIYLVTKWSRKDFSGITEDAEQSDAEQPDVEQPTLDT